MKSLFASTAIVAALCSTAYAAEPGPLGDWLVQDGYGIIRIDNCNGKMWGIVAWEKEPGGLDNNNPDPAKRGRPSLGVPIVIGMAPTKPNRWEGEIYNTENGKTYSGSISVLDEHSLQLEGCLFPNFLCGGQKWTRVATLPASGVALPSAQPKGTQSKAAAAKKGATATSDVCMRVAGDEASLAAKAAKK